MEIGDAFFAITIALIAISVFGNVYSLNRFMKDTTNYMRDNNANVRELLKLVMSINEVNRETIANFNDRLLSVERKMDICSSGGMSRVTDGKFVYHSTTIGESDSID